MANAESSRTASLETRKAPGSGVWVAMAVVVALAVAAVSSLQPAAMVAAIATACFLASYFYRRDLLVGALFCFLLFQNLAFTHLRTTDPQLAQAVKHADDVLIIFFALALTAEALLPTLRLEAVPLWRSFCLLILVCLVSAAYNRLSLRETSVGTYVLLKNFVWFYLAASLRLDERGFRRVFRFLVVILGAVLAFGFFQFATGELTYNLLGLPRDYRLGILRLRSIFIRPVYLGETMALLAVLSISAYMNLRNPLYVALAAAAIAAVGLTMLLKTILALGLVLGLLLLRKRPLLFVPYVLAGVLSIISFSEYAVQNIKTQYSIYIESPRSVRREGYRICGEILRDSPIFGVGPGMFGGFAATLLGSPIPQRYGFINYDQLEYSTIDSHWPHLAAEIGLLGLLIYGWFLWASASKAWRLSKQADLPAHFRILAMTAAVFFLVAVAEGFAAANFEDTLTGFLIFPILGMCQRPPGQTTATSPAATERSS